MLFVTTRARAAPPRARPRPVATSRAVVHCPRRTRTARRARALALALVASLLAAGCAYSTTLPALRSEAESSKLFFADGTLLTSVHAEINREEVPLDKMAAPLRTAVVAIEDSRFYDHDGVDPRGILRAFTRNAEEGKVSEGGSTITQQYVRAVLLDSDQSLSRKIKEAALAVQFERTYSKDEILERYLNTVYFGAGAYGVEAAANVYFGKGAADLDLAQSALIAGLLQAPETYNPLVHPEAAVARRNVVLDRMTELTRATPADVAAAKATPLQLAPGPQSVTTYPAGHFVEQVKKFILANPAFGATVAEREHKLLTGGLRITTTLDQKTQFLAQEAIAKILVEPDTDPGAALVSVDPRNGHVVAYVGGRNFFGTTPQAKFDLAGQGLRQPGSSFKPFVLAAAIQAGVPLTRTYNAPGEITIPIKGQQPWDVRNYDGEGGGRMTIGEATVKSVNTVYAQLIMDIGPQRVIEMASALGIKSPLLAVPSAALGTNEVTVLDMASAYATLAADGMRVNPVFVSRVTDADGKVLFEAPTSRERVLPANTARQVNSILEDVVNRGTGVNARIGRPVAGKTGTAEEWSNAWFVGSTPELTTAVWVGFPQDNRSMVPPETRTKVTGGTWPAQIWQLYEGAALAEVPITNFSEPDGLGANTPEPTAVPNVVGMPSAEARRLLIDAGWKVDTQDKPNRDYPPGTVVAQTPDGGEKVKPGTTILMTVANGSPRTVATPLALGLLTDQAVAQLRNAGLDIEVNVESEPPPGSADRAGKVWKQTPIGGANVDMGTKVTISVNPR